MFAATHMAVGALIESRVRWKAATALIALASAAALDMTIFWDSRAAEYDWPRDSPPIPHVVPILTISEAGFSLAFWFSRPSLWAYCCAGTGEACCGLWHPISLTG